MAKLQHIAENGDAAAMRTRFERAGHSKSRPHRGRIGVIALVDQGKGAGGRRNHDPFAATFLRLEKGQRLDSRVEVGSGTLDGEQDRKRVFGEMTALRA